VQSGIAREGVADILGKASEQYLYSEVVRVICTHKHEHKRVVTCLVSTIRSLKCTAATAPSTNPDDNLGGVFGVNAEANAV
jgi:hypothetical protein